MALVLIPLDCYPGGFWSQSLTGFVTEHQRRQAGPPVSQSEKEGIITSSCNKPLAVTLLLPAVTPCKPQTHLHPPPSSPASSPEPALSRHQTKCWSWTGRNHKDQYTSAPRNGVVRYPRRHEGGPVLLTPDSYFRTQDMATIWQSLTGQVLRGSDPKDTRLKLKIKKWSDIPPGARKLPFLGNYEQPARFIMKDSISSHLGTAGGRPSTVSWVAKETQPRFNA